MPLTCLRVERFRCLRQVEVALDPSVNLFIGPNASGKTSLLEAAYFLGRARSFRTRRRQPLIQRGAGDFLIAGQCKTARGSMTLGVRVSGEVTEMRVDGTVVRTAGALAEHFPTQALDPEVHKLLEEGPARRRRFLDWGVFHVEPEFLDLWHRYHLSLRQRNAALKRGLGRAAVKVWDQDLATSGERLAEQRSRYLDLLQVPLAQIGRSLLGAEITLAHHRGWSENSSLAEQLAKGIEADERQRVTTAGPHRADLVVGLGDRMAKGMVSRGQQKLLAAGLLLAQLKVQEAGGAGSGALMLDDPAAELDAANLDRLMAIVRQLRAQLWVSSLTPEVPGLPSTGRTFHVEHGSVKEQS